MKKLLFLLMISFLSFPLFSQEWKTVNIDSAVSFKLPKGFIKTKTADENNFSAQTPFGTILIFKAPDDAKVTPDIEKDKHLNQFYTSYLERVKSSSSDAIITDEKDTLLGNLKVKDFTLAVDSGSGKQLRKFRILHANNATYTFEFLFQEIHKDYAAEECNKFFNSISVKEDLDRSDQFTADNIPGSQPNYYLIGAIVLVILGIILFFSLRRRK
ncbi:hypothetical protein [Daejeonella oryzae]|uniref:hypothetical protein n=1 Tax=Daejeonella oryzae TaxID=1122943 RepID=UPI00040EEB4C|nr:hypothetical protein [Daejeonella oryzae]